MSNNDIRIKSRTTTQRSALKSSLGSENTISRFTSQHSSRKTTLLPTNC